MLLQYTTTSLIVSKTPMFYYVFMSCRTPLGLLVTFAIITGYWWYTLVPSLFSESEHVRIHFLDVGQGDSILIETPNNFQVLVDAGRGIKVLDALDKIVPIHDKTIDVAVMTHPDADHIGGFVPVFKRYEVDTVIHSFISSDTSVYKAVMEAVKKENAAVYTISQAYSFILDDVRFDILWPLNEDVTEKNTASVVLLITHGSIQTLLTGDAPSTIEEFLIHAFGEMIDDIEILKAGHHGSKTSTSQSFLTHTRPDIIIYSAGKNNSYGHPHQEVLDRVSTYAQKQGDGVAEYSTTDGTISFCINTSHLALCDDK